MLQNFVNLAMSCSTNEYQLTCNKSWAISVNNLSTLSLDFADVSRKYMECRCENSSPTSVGISLSSLSILFPANLESKIKVLCFLYYFDRIIPLNKDSLWYHFILPTRTLSTLGDAYSSISRSQSGQQSNVGWLETSYTNIKACADR